MENDTSVTINGTQAAFSSNVNKFTFMFAFILISLYFLILMFQTFFSTRAFRESSRYVLFAHMLLIDTIQLLVAVILAILKMLMLRLPVPVCSVLIFISVATYLSTPLNLAVMSLERYIAICFPLRHAEICCVERAWIAMMAIWITGSAPSIADNILLHVSVRKSFFSTNVLCTRDSVTVTSAQTIFLFVVRIFMLVLVAMTIMYTYVKIMLEAKKVNVDKTSTSKARKTVILHGVQLSLCMLSFIFPLTDPFLKQLSTRLWYNLNYINFFIFVLFPRFLSPLIYGLRDETFRNSMKEFLPCHPSRVIPVRPSTT
uniref:G-protein coupled receptors family 1 profile domain-containing protein n=2 Tax=Latimeria chalumnae TaxID=7897 RepID=H3ACF4_LATCH